MEIITLVTVAFVALAASLLTFFSGFGLGTILTPVMAVFFPVEQAVALTGIVHLLNNFFKVTLIGKHFHWEVGSKFGLMAMIGAFIGAWLMQSLVAGGELFSYSIDGHIFTVTVLKLVLAFMMGFFVLFEILPYFRKLQFQKDKLYAGGFLSGFFGGLSGHQGALRSAFLLRCGLQKESYIATGIVIACAVDVTRLTVYATHFTRVEIGSHFLLLSIAILSSFVGAFLGSKLIHKITIATIQKLVGVLIILLAAALAAGII